METLVTQLIAGAVGGNAAGVGLKSSSMGTMLNTVVGLIGGVGSGQIIGMLTGGAAVAGEAAAPGAGVGGLLASAVGGGAGGAILTAIVGMVKNKLAG